MSLYRCLRTLCLSQKFPDPRSPKFSVSSLCHFLTPYISLFFHYFVKIKGMCTIGKVSFIWTQYLYRQLSTFIKLLFSIRLWFLALFDIYQKPKIPTHQHLAQFCGAVVCLLSGYKKFIFWVLLFNYYIFIMYSVIFLSVFSLLFYIILVFH